MVLAPPVPLKTKMNLGWKKWVTGVKTFWYQVWVSVRVSYVSVFGCEMMSMQC
jgi:hypothetical protein